MTRSRGRGGGHALTGPLLATCLLAGCGAGSPAPDRPSPRPDEFWRSLFEAHSARASNGAVDLLFLGDSITQGWGNTKVWERYYGHRRAASFGIGGDHTEHLLWEIDHGMLDGVVPELIVLMIGTNNLGHDSPAAIAGGVEAVLDRLRERFPGARVLLLGVLPRGPDRDEMAPTDEPDPRTFAVNEALWPLDRRDGVTLLDLSAAFLDAEGRVQKMLMPDYLHLSDEGYFRWAEAMEPTLSRLLGEPSRRVRTGR